jgi:hypothetical protein
MGLLSLGLPFVHLTLIFTRLQKVPRAKRQSSKQPLAFKVVTYSGVGLIARQVTVAVGVVKSTVDTDMYRF